MFVKELVQELEQVSYDDLQDVATYIAFLRFRTWQTKQGAVTEADGFGKLCAEFAREDREAAEAGMRNYLCALQAEDVA